LSQSKRVKIHHYNVFGVYFAWPGKTIGVPYLKYLTFWNRKQAAERIASNGDCLDAIEKLSQAARLKENNYVFLIGHSFGGLILERTVEHTLRTLQGAESETAMGSCFDAEPCVGFGFGKATSQRSF